MDLVIAEHDLSHLSIFSLDRDAVVRYFGTGMDAYFQFVLFTGTINVILQLITLVFAVSSYCTSSTESRSFWSTLTFGTLADITNEDANQKLLNIQLICLVVSILLLLVGSLISFYRVSRSRQRSTRSLGRGASGGVLDGYSRELIPNDDRIAALVKSSLPGWRLTLLRMIAVVLFGLLFLAYYHCQVALQAWVIDWSIDTATSGDVGGIVVGLGGQTLMSLFFVLVDAVWRMSCNLLTSLESHKYLLPHRESDCIKSFLCRVVMFSIFVYVQQPPIAMESRANQMMNLLLVNTLTSPIIDVLTIWLYRNSSFCCLSCRCVSCKIPNCCCGVHDVDVRQDNNDDAVGTIVKSPKASPVGSESEAIARRIATNGVGSASVSASSMPFNLADEYTQLLFRQYLVNQCLTFVPLAPLAGMIGCLLEWWTDKFKLIRYCRVHERHGDRFFKIVVAFLSVNTVAPLLAYPNGYVWRQEFS